MSLELGGKSKSIRYLNLTKSGVESSNRKEDTQECMSVIKFRNTPFLEDQSNYLVAVTRFSVPLVEVPTIASTGFTVYHYKKASLDRYLKNTLGGIPGFAAMDT